MNRDEFLSTATSLLFSLLYIFLTNLVGAAIFLLVFFYLFFFFYSLVVFNYFKPELLFLLFLNFETFLLDQNGMQLSDFCGSFYVTATFFFFFFVELIFFF